jgi:hypothetical protein
MVRDLLEIPQGVAKTRGIFRILFEIVEVSESIK